jgi:hypothetical protein
MTVIERPIGPQPGKLKVQFERLMVYDSLRQKKTRGEVARLEIYFGEKNGSHEDNNEEIALGSAEWIEKLAFSQSIVPHRRTFSKFQLKGGGLSME